MHFLNTFYSYKCLFNKPHVFRCKASEGLHDINNRGTVCVHVMGLVSTAPRVEVLANTVHSNHIVATSTLSFCFKNMSCCDSGCRVYVAQAALNSCSSCLSLQSARIRGTCSHTVKEKLTGLCGDAE